MVAVPFPADVPEDNPPTQELALRQPPERPHGLNRLAVAVVLGVGIAVAGAVLLWAPALPTAKPAPPRPDAPPLLDTTPQHLPHVPTGYGDLARKVAGPAPGPAPDAVPATPKPTGGRADPPPLTEAQQAAKKAREGGFVLGNDARRTTAAISPPSLPAPVLPGPPEPSAPSTTPGGKAAFLAQAAQLHATQVQDRLHTPESPYMLMAGTVIPASLETGIQSTLPGQLKARVRRNITDTVTQQHLLIPKGTVLLGTYDDQVVYGEDRVLVVWQRLVFENGKSIQLEAMPGVDLKGLSGLKDKVDNHYRQLFGSVLLSSLMSIGVRAPFGNTQGYQPSLAQEFAQEFSAGMNQAGQQIVQRELNRKPTPKIRPAMSFSVFVHKDLVLAPYGEP